MNATDILNRGINAVEEKSKIFLKDNGVGYGKLIDAMNYSVSAGGKRLRPALLLEFYRLCGGTHFDDAENFATALEFIHSYSLIHDDLPCMDNDDIRRGKPSCHIAYGEDTALLAGDALLTMAFSLACECKNIDSANVLSAIKLLANYAGLHGMVGGQVIDLDIEGKDVPIQTVKKMYALKTGALIKAACEIGCVLAGADSDKMNAATLFSEKIGLAFQVADDILDLIGDSAVLGKPVGSDDKNNKSTYVSHYGIEKSKADVIALTNEAIDALSVFSDDADALRELAQMLTDRKN